MAAPVSESAALRTSQTAGISAARKTALEQRGQDVELPCLSRRKVDFVAESILTGGLLGVFH